MTYLIQKKPTEKPIIKMKGYALYSTGELWKTGKHGYRAGYVMNKNEDGMIIAIEKNIARKMIRKAIQTKGRAEIRRAIKKDLKGAPNDPWVLAFDQAFKELMKESK